MKQPSRAQLEKEMQFLAKKLYYHLLDYNNYLHLTDVDGYNRALLMSYVSVLQRNLRLLFK